MWRFYSFRLGLFLLTVAGAEQEDFQSNLPEQTKGTVVTKYGLMVKTDAIVRGTEAVPTQTTYRGTEEETATKFPKTKVFDTELKPTNEGMQTTTSLVTALQSMEHLRSSNVQNTLKSSTAYLSESKVPLKSNYEKLVLSSPQAALALNNAFETQVHLSADAVKATPWFHAPRAIGNHRNANSVIPTSADTGLLHLILSASHPRVIDNLMELFNDSDDKRPQGKSITNLGGNVDLSGTTQSILQSDPTEDLMKGNAVTDLCLTCLKDGKVMSRKEFAAQPAASPHVSSGSLSLATLSHNFHPLLAGKSKEIKDRNSTKDAIIFNHTFLPFTLNKTENQSVSFVSQIAAEMSSVTNYYTTIHPTQTYPGKALVPAKPNLTSTAQYASSKSLYTGEKPVKYGQQEVFYKKVSFREPQSKLMHFTESKKKASRSLSTNLKNQDISSEPVSNAPLSAPHSSFNSLLPKGLAHSSASHPTARMNLIEALGAITPVTLCRPTASTVKNLKSRFLTARAGPFISVSSSQTESKAASPTKQPILTLSPKGPTISLPSVTPKHFLDEKDSQTFTFEDSIVKQSPVNFQTTMNMIAMIKLQASNFGAKKVTPVRIFGSRSRLGSDNQSALTRLMSTSFTKKQKEAQSKTIQHVTVVKFNSKLFSESQNIHSLKLEERKEVFSVVAENEDKDILQTKSNHSREITETDEILTLNKEDEILENKREILLRLDNPRIGKLGEIFNSTAETNQNTYREAVKMKGFITKTSRQEHVTLRHDKDLQHAEVKDEGDAKRGGVTKINTETSTLGASGKQRHFLEEKEAQPGNVDNIKFNKDIWKQDLTNAPLQPATNWKELNGDKERIVEKLSSCHGLIKELDASEHKGVHLGENASQIGDLTNKSFSFVVTSNRQLPHPSVRSQALDLKAELPKEDITLPLKETSPQEVKGTFPATALHKLSEFIDMLKPLISPSSSAAKKANLSLTTQFQRAQSHFIVNSSLNELIIHSTTDHKHKFNCSVFKAEPVLHRVNEQGHAEYVTPSIHQRMYDDSSTKTPTVTALSSQPRIYLGPLQRHRGQSAAQRSHSSSCSNTTPGQLCPSRLSEQASYPDTSAVKKKQIFSQAPTLSGIPAAGINRLPFKRVSPVMKLRTFRSDRLTVTSMLQKLTRSQQINFVPRSNSSESLLGTSGEANQSKKKHDVMFMMTLNAKQSDGVTGDKQTTVRSKHVANNTDEFNSTTLQIENKTKQNDLTNAGGKDEANNIIMTPKHHHRFELEDSMQFGHVTNYVDTTDRAGTAAFSQADSLPKRPKIQLDDELYPSSVIKHGVAKTTERHNSQSLTQQSESNNSVHIANSNLSINLTLKHQISAQQRITTSQFEIKANKTTDIVSQTVTPVAIRGGFNSLLNMSETLPDSKKSTQNAFEHISQPSAQTKPLTQRELPITLSSDKLTPAVQRIKIIETHIVQKQPKQRILAQAAKQGQHALLSTTALSHTINMPKSEFLKMAHRAGEGYGQTSAATEQMSDLSLKGIKSVRYLLENIYGEHSQDRVDEHKKHTLPETTSISQAVFAHMTDFVPHAKIPPTEFMNKTSCTSIGCAVSSETTKAGVIDHTEEMYKTQIPEKDNLHAQNANKTKFRNNWSFHHSLPGKPAPQAIKLKVELSPVTSKWEHDYPSDDTVSKGAKSTSDKTVHLERKDTRQWSKFTTKTTQRRFQNTSRAAATEAALSESGRAAVETTIKSTEHTLPVERNTTTQLDRRAGRARMLEEQNASRSPHAQAKKETAGPESGSRLLVSELQTKSELPRLNQRRRTSPHQYVSGVTEISDDLCGSGNYTAEMRLKMGRILEPGDVVPAHGNLRVIINLKTNNSQINLGVTSCCLSPILQLDVTNSTCCLFSRPAAELSGITLLPSALTTSASFTISLFQMINYSVVYLHCDLSVCLKNHSDCERQRLQRRNTFPSEDAGTVVANRISFGPMLKQANNSTFPTEIDPSELDLVLVFISLAIGFSLISVMLLLVWLAYHRRAIWLLRSAAPSQACCSCLRPGGDLILP